MPKYEPCDVTLTLNDVHSMIDEERKLVAPAFQYARGAHKDQVRKYTGIPYISHPLSVYRLLREFGIHDMEIRSVLTSHVLWPSSPTLVSRRMVTGHGVKLWTDTI